MNIREQVLFDELVRKTAEEHMRAMWEEHKSNTNPVEISRKLVDE